MKKVLILCLHRPGRSPSQRFRFEQYLDFLTGKGYEFTFSYLLSQEDDKIFYQPGHTFKKAGIVLKSIWKRWKEIRNTGHYDLVFVQRESFMLGTAWFEKKIAKKVPLIFDFDDAIWLQFVSEANKKLFFLKDASKTAKIISVSHWIFAGNQYLAKYATKFNRNITIIPTTIDTALYAPVAKSKKNKSICIGWTGSFSTLQHFKRAIPALKRIKDKYGSGVSFKIIGDKSYYCAELEAQGEAWVAVTEIEELLKIDLGIMPLPDDEWAKGKCGLKGLQYMSLAIPTLMSAVGVNSEIIQHGVNGYLPDKEDEWVNILSNLIDDMQLRERIGKAGRQTVVSRYSVEAWKYRYLEIFNKLTSNA